MSDKKEMRCSFCHKSREDVKKMIAGGKDNVFICNECVELCNDILREELGKTVEPEKQVETPESEKQEILEIKKIDSVTFHNPEDWSYWDSKGRKHPGSASELGTYHANGRTRISIKYRDGVMLETEVLKESRLTTYDDVAHIRFWVPKE